MVNKLTGGNVKTKILILLAFLSSAFYAQTNRDSLIALYRESVQAYQKADYANFLNYTKKALEVDPANYNLKYNLACGYALLGEKDKSVKALSFLVDKGLGEQAETDADFNGIRESDEFKAVLEKIKKNKIPVNNSSTAFVIKEKDLIPEGIAYDPVENVFYVGSIFKSKILKIDKDGNVSEFVSEGKDGLVSVIGMKVDVKRRELIAASSSGGANERLSPDKIGTSSLYRFDLSTGKLIARYELDKAGNHFLNDVTVLSNGDIYASDSRQSALYLISPSDNTIKKFMDMQSPNANGIAATPDEKKLFVSVNGEIELVNIADKKSTYVKHPEDMYIGDCDGLYFYENSLIGVQNGALTRVARFYLNDDLTEATKMEVIESYNPDFILPTTGTIADGYFYYIANSQILSIGRDGKVPMDKLKDVIILKAKLK
jgi:hypothetical protein